MGLKENLMSESTFLILGAVFAAFALFIGVVGGIAIWSERP